MKQNMINTNYKTSNDFKLSFNSIRCKKLRQMMNIIESDLFDIETELSLDKKSSVNKGLKRLHRLFRIKLDNLQSLCYDLDKLCREGQYERIELIDELLDDLRTRVSSVKNILSLEKIGA
jgi:hypothetical protein